MGARANKENQVTIAQAGGVAPLVELLKEGALSAQETVAGALHALAETADNRVDIAGRGGIPLLVSLDGGSEVTIEQAALQTLVVHNVPNQLAVANEAVAMLKGGSTGAQEHVTKRSASSRRRPTTAGDRQGGAVPELVRQLECGSEKAMGLAAQALALIALKSAEHRATVTHELVKLLGSNKEAVRQRASEALTDMAADDNSTSKSRSGRAHRSSTS